MTLPVTNLDDRRFQDLVDEAKRRIPDHCKEWTNHNVSDPGVALIELFAWMTELTLFRLNQVPDNFYTHMLNLVGFEPFPATAASTDLTFWLVGPVDDTVTIADGTQVATAGVVGEERVFTTVGDLHVRRPNMVGALTSSGAGAYVDVWSELDLDFDSVVCFPRLEPDEAFYLGFDDSLAGAVLQLTVKANIEGTGVKPLKPPLEWEVWQGEGWMPITVHSDSTGALNTDGVIVLLMPQAHEPLILSGKPCFWIRAKLLAKDVDRPTYNASPQVRTIKADCIGGTIMAEHSDRAPMEMLGTSNGKPDQRFEVEFRPVMERNATEHVIVVDPNGAEAPWTEVADFSESTAEATHYTWNSTTGTITFGPNIRYPDGTSKQHGAVPGEGARISVTGYRHGGGDAGNVGARTLTSMRSTISYVARVENLSAAVGGVDAETVANAKLRGPQTLRAGGRAVTVADYERLAHEADPAIARVRCLPPSEHGKPIRLLLVPNVDTDGLRLPELDDYALPATMVGRVASYLDHRRILGATVEIGTPFYQGVSIAVLVTRSTLRPVAMVRDRVLNALYQFVDPLTGGLDGHGWPFDNDLNVASIYQLIEAIDGVERVDEALLFTYDLRQEQRMGSAKELIKLEPNSLFLSAAHKVVVR